MICVTGDRGRWVTLMRDNSTGPAKDRTRSWRFAIRIRKRNILRAGLGIVIGLLVFSTANAYQIQQSVAKETMEIYHRHVRQDDQLWRLRRSLWLGANTARDFLLNPHPDRNERFAVQIAELKGTSRDLLADLGRAPEANVLPANLRSNIADFWATLERIPRDTANLGAADRYEFVQREITPRRAFVGELVREFTQLGQDSLRISESELAHSRREGASRLLWVLGLSVVVAFAVAGFSVAHSESLERQAAQQYEEVEQARKELQRFANRLMQIQEEERTRLSRELHDEIGQALATLRLEVSRAASLSGQSPPEVRERLVRASELAQRTVQTVRDISAWLRPSLLDDLGLEPALEFQVEDFTRRTGVLCDLRLEGLRDTALPDSVTTCVYRVIQESLHNCEKHAAASKVTVTITQGPQLLTVAVQDDGKGFHAEGVSGGFRTARFGILGMRERAAALGGSMQIQSAAGRGARVVLCLPLAKVGVTEGERHELEVRA